MDFREFHFLGTRVNTGGWRGAWFGQSLKIGRRKGTEKSGAKGTSARTILEGRGRITITLLAETGDERTLPLSLPNG
jgi:hypothetical protein